MKQTNKISRREHEHTHNHTITHTHTHTYIYIYAASFYVVFIYFISIFMRTLEFGGQNRVADKCPSVVYIYIYIYAAGEIVLLNNRKYVTVGFFLLSCFRSTGH